MAKGRDVPELPKHTFKDSGITVSIRRLSPLTADEVLKAVKRERTPPNPPDNLVDYGDGKKVPEPNPSDPAYEQALAEYNAWVNQEVSDRIMKLVTHRAVVCDVDTDAVTEFRADMTAIGVTLDDDDKAVYVRHICVSTLEDLEELRQAVMERSQPTEKEIQANIDSFRAEVPGT